MAFITSVLQHWQVLLVGRVRLALEALVELHPTTPLQPLIQISIAGRFILGKQPPRSHSCPTAPDP